MDLTNLRDRHRGFGSATVRRLATYRAVETTELVLLRD
jgi:hypothetical protein